MTEFNNGCATKTIETTRNVDRDDTVLFITNEGVVPASKSQLGINVKKGVVAGRIDVTGLPKNAVAVFLRYLVRNEAVNEEISIRDVATLIYLADLYSINNLLTQISECMIQASRNNGRSLCLCYNLSVICNLHIKTQLAKLVAIKFDEVNAILCEVVEDSEYLLPILQRCDVNIQNEKELVMFIIDWSLSHTLTKKQCVRLLSCTRKSLISEVDMETLTSYVRDNAAESMNDAWNEYEKKSSSSFCWNATHIMKKWPRCGMKRVAADPSLKGAYRDVLKHDMTSLSVNDGDDGNDGVTEHYREMSSKRKCQNVHERTASSMLPKVTRKNAFVCGFLKLRRKFGRKFTN